MTIQIIILAAGLGKRMHSSVPKMLHLLAGKPILEHVICNALTLTPERSPIIIYGHQGERIRAHLGHYDLRWVEQKEQLGTAHAVKEALPYLDLTVDRVLILYGDVPLVTVATLKKLIQSTASEGLSLLTASLPDATGYGRILRENGHIIGIVEEKDADENSKKISEVNSGIYCVNRKDLEHWLPRIQSQNAQKEFYLTDIVTFAFKENKKIQSVMPETYQEILGINDCVQLSAQERFYQHRQAQKLMQQGVTLYDPARLDVRGHVKVGRDVIIDVNVIFEGDVTIGDACYIGPHSYLRNTCLGNAVEIKGNSYLDGVEIGNHAQIGPFARLRPGTVLENEVHIGNFVEVKNSYIENKSKVNHLSYIGDCEIGERVNIGAGTITCNYDGYNKHKTIIGDDVHIGSDTQLIAPVSIGDGATIGAGSTITKPVPGKKLTLTHQLCQRSLSTWERPQKKDD